jgi:hypothetical protein
MRETRCAVGSPPPSSRTDDVALDALQGFMARAIQRPAPLVEDAADLGPMIGTSIAGNERLSPAEQLDVYREQFWLRHIGSLRDDFPSLVHVLGDDDFAELSRAYLDRHPPVSFTLRDLGHQLAAFVAATPPWKSDPLLSDIARLEWAFIEAFDAPDAPRLDVSTLAHASEDAWSKARVVFQPALRCLSLQYPVHDLRGSVRAGEPAERPAARDAWVVIYRGGLGHDVSVDPGTLQYLDVDPVAFQLVDALAKGIPLAVACEQIATAKGVALAADLEAQVGSWFQQWAGLGWISRVDFG